MVGYLVCGRRDLKNGKAYFAVGKIAFTKIRTDKKFKTVSATAKMTDLQFQVQIGQVLKSYFFQ